MASLQFLLPRREGLAQQAVQCAYMVGNDGSPWESQVEIAGGRLQVRRDARESGRLIAPWRVAGHGAVALSTATLLPRDAPYHLALELNRGTLSRILGQFSPTLLEQPAIAEQLREAQRHFVSASLQQHDVERSALEAETSLAICLNLIRKCLVAAWRTNAPPHAFSSRLHGFHVESPRQLQWLAKSSGYAATNSVFCQRHWRDTEPNPGDYQFNEWHADLRRIRQTKRRAACGPLLRLSRSALPDWLYLWSDDFDSIQSYVVTYIQRAVDRLRSEVNLWYVTAGTNVDAELELSEEQRLRLTLAAIETLRHIDTQLPVLVGIRQPWGEYLGHAPLDLSPWQFADIIVRSELGVSGFVLEMEVGCAADRTLPRDLLELNRLIDHWATFGLPLVVELTTIMPASDNDANLTQQNEITAMTRDMIGLLQQKPVVQGVVWGQLCDDSQSAAGVFDPSGAEKPLLSILEKVWRTGGSES